MQEIIIYTDGGAKPNPGDGGWAAILMTPDLRHLKILSGAEDGVTNNQMELRAVIEGLKSIKVSKAHIKVHTDSSYVASGPAWIPGWRARGWRTSSGKPVKNVPDWLVLDGLLRAWTVDLIKVRGHSSNFWNNLADRVVSAQINGLTVPTEQQARGEYARWKELMKVTGNT